MHAQTATQDDNDMATSSRDTISDVDLRVLAFCNEIFFRSTLVAVVAGLSVAALLVVAFAGAPGVPNLVPWFFIVFCVYLMRLAFTRIHASPARSLLGPLTWNRVCVLLSAAAGLGWGSSAIWFFPVTQPAYQALVGNVLGGIAAGALGSNGQIVRAYWAWIVLAMCPYVIQCIRFGGHIGLFYALIGAIYMVFMCVTAYRYAVDIEQTLRVRFENERLVSTLTEAKMQTESLNRDLLSEIEQRQQSELGARNAMEKAEAANRAKSDFLATVSHEVRTPMNGILGMLSIVRNSPFNDSQKHRIDAAYLSAETLLGILNDILDFSKIEAGKLELESIDFNLHQSVEHVRGLFEENARKKNTRIRAVIEDGVPKFVRGDALRLRQILTNLVSNAVKFTSEGEVTIRVNACDNGDDAHTVSFCVRDTGIGIPPEAQSKLFLAFSQADQSINRKYGGTGLGLAICRRLVGMMGGTIGVESEPGKGSAFTFHIAMPKVQPPSRSAVDSLRPPALQKKHPSQLLPGPILLVEDNPINQEVARGFLDMLGAREIHIAADGAAGVEAFKQHRHSLILMDCQMPVMDGYEASRRIRQMESSSSAKPIIIALTANTMEGDRDRCLQAGMDDFLGKPMRLEALAACLGRWFSADGHLQLTSSVIE